MTTTETFPDVLADARIAIDIANSAGRSLPNDDVACILDRIESALASAEPVAIVGERGDVSWRSETILPVGTKLYTHAKPAAKAEALASDAKATYSDQDVLDEVRAMVKLCFESQAAFAKSRNVSPAYVSDILNGRRAMPEQWAVLAGFSRPKWFRDTPKRWTDMGAAAPTPASDYPECSGDPASCPENEGHGCCKPNPVKTPASVPDGWPAADDEQRELG